MGITKTGLGQQRLAFGLIMCFLFGSILVFQLPAAATHPADSCLDVEPETDSNPTGTTHVVTATLRTSSTMNPLTPSCPDTAPASNDATNTKAATAPVTVNFEITGANDPDAGDTPATPDRTC